MNRGKLTKHLSLHGCRLHRNGARHDMWTNADGTLFMPVPRHSEVSQGVVRRVCGHFGIPEPLGK